jgi:hypothetical protein
VLVAAFGIANAMPASAAPPSFNTIQNTVIAKLTLMQEVTNADHANPGEIIGEKQSELGVLQSISADELTIKNATTAAVIKTNKAAIAADAAEGENYAQDADQYYQEVVLDHQNQIAEQASLVSYLSANASTLVADGVYADLQNWEATGASWVNQDETWLQDSATYFNWPASDFGSGVNLVCYAVSITSFFVAGPEASFVEIVLNSAGLATCSL